MRTAEIIFVLLMSLIVTACTEPEKPILRIATNTWPGYESLYWAHHKGYLPNDRFHLVEAPSATEAARVFRNGLVEAAALTVDEALLLAAQGFRPKIVLIFDYSNGADTIIGQKYVDSFAGLKGKRIGVENTALGAFFLARALEINKLKTSDVKMVYMEADKHYQAFVNGDIDAIVTFEPSRGKILKKGGRVLFDSSQIPMEITDVLVIEEKYYPHFRENIELLQKAWAQAHDETMRPKSDEIFEFMARREHTSVELFKESLALLKLIDPIENAKLSTSSPLIEDQVKKLSAFMKEAGLLKGSQNELDLFLKQVPIEN
jgi:NitT/TauT family transport system substrate-binding protein